MNLVRRYLAIFLGALLLRLLFMPFLFHPDIKTQYYHADLLRQGVFNIYDYISEHKETLPYRDTFNYPPLTYYFLGSYAFISQPILGLEFQSWLNNWGEGVYTNPQIFRQMFVLKLPYLILDLMIGGILIHLLDEKCRKRALLIWFFNPITIYIIYGLANFDVIPTFFSLLSLLLFSKQKYLYSGIALGVGISTKIFPILFLPFFLMNLVLTKKYREGLVFGAAAMGVFLLSISALFQDFLGIQQSGLLTKVLEVRIDLVLFSIPIFYLLYGVILGASVFLKKDWESINWGIVACCLLIISISRFHPQWLLWGLPFLTLLLARNLKLLILMGVFSIAYFGHILTFKDRFLSLGILSPIFPMIYEVGALEETLFARIDLNQFLNLVKMTIVGISVWLIGFYLLQIKLWAKKD